MMSQQKSGLEMPGRPLLITVDGPAGSGKSTVSRILAKRLCFRYIDTGALYRGVAFHAEAAGIDPDDDKGLEKLCANIHLSFLDGPKGLRLMSGNSDITDFIRTPEITRYASTASAKPSVRNYLLHLQRELGKQKGVVFEGRDMGTVVFPDADIKFFLEASHQVRASRRYNELKSGSGQTLEAVSKAMRQRDKENRTRELAPLKPATDAVMIDSTTLSIEAVLEEMQVHIQRLN